MAKIYNYITEEEKIKLARITQDCLDTHVFNPPKGFINLTVLDKDGQEIERHEMLSKSWTRNFYNSIFLTMFRKTINSEGSAFGDGTLMIKDTAGSAYDVNYNGYPYDIVGSAGSAVKGIVVGSGNTAESFGSYALTSKIANGTGAGQLSYAAGEAFDLTWSSGTREFSLLARRYFNNNSGAAIDVNEVGWYADYIYDGSYVKNLMLNRDLLPSTLSIPNGGRLKVDYIFKMVYPS